MSSYKDDIGWAEFHLKKLIRLLKIDRYQNVDFPVDKYLLNLNENISIRQVSYLFIFLPFNYKLYARHYR